MQKTAAQEALRRFQTKIAQGPLVDDEGYAMLNPDRPRISQGMGTGMLIGGGLGAAGAGGLGAYTAAVPDEKVVAEAAEAASKGGVKAKLMNLAAKHPRIAAALGLGTLGAAVGGVSGMPVGGFINTLRQDAFDKRQRRDAGVDVG